MGHAIWKLTSLVGISGLGLLILLQAQRGVQDSKAKTAAVAEANGVETEDVSTPEPSSEREPSKPPDDTAGHVHLAGHDHHAHEPGGHEHDGDAAAGSDANPFATGSAPASAGEMTPVTQREPLPEDELSVALAANDEPAASEASPFGEGSPSPVEQANFEETAGAPQPFRRESEPEAIATAETPEESPSDAPAFLGAETSSGEENGESENEPPATDAGDFGPNPFAAMGVSPEPEGETAPAASEPELAPGPAPAPAGVDLEEPEASDSAASEETPAQETPAEPATPEEDAPEPAPAEELPAAADPFGTMPTAPEAAGGDSVPIDAAPEEPTPDPASEPTPAPEPMVEETGEAPSPTPDLPDPFGAVQPEAEPMENGTVEPKTSEPTPMEAEPAPESEAAPEPDLAVPEAAPFGSLDDDPFAGLHPAEEMNSETETEAPPPSSEPPASNGGVEASDPVEPVPSAEDVETETDSETATEDDPFATIEGDPFGTAPEQPAPEMHSPPVNDPLGAPEVEPDAETGKPAEPFMSGPETESLFGGSPGVEARPEPLAGGEDAETMPSGPPAEPDLALPDIETPEPFPAEPLPDEDDGGETADNDPGEDAPAAVPPSTGGVGTVVTDSPRDPRQAQLTVEKKAPARAALGEPLIYEIVVTNVGESPADEVTVSDVVPKGAKLDGTIPQAIMKGDRLTWKLGTLAPRESSSIRIRVVPTEPGSIGSVATVNFESEIAAETEIVAPKLVLRLSAPDTATLGQPVEFRFEIANEGSAPAENVMLRDVLPAGFRHADGNDLEYEVGTLPAGAVKQVTLRVATVKAGEFSNRAVLTGQGGLKAEASASVTVTGQQVSLIRKGPKRRFVGRPAKYTNIVRNTSSEPVTSAKILETIPSGMEFVRASQGGQYNPQDRTVAWQVGPLAPGEEATVEVTLTAAVEGTQDSLVRVEEVGSSGVQVASTTKVSSPAGLASEIEGPDQPVIIGERAAFRIHLENQGTAPAEDVLVSLMLPAQLRFIEARGGDAIPSARGVTTVRTANPLPAGEERTIEFVVEGVAAGNAKLRASIHAGQLGSPLVREAELQVVAARS